MNNNIFRDLATLLGAGLDPSTAIEKLAKQSKDFEKWKAASKSIKQGSLISSALLKQQIISQDQASWLKAAEQCGQTEHALKSIEKAKTKRETRIKILKGKMVYPFFIMLVAMICHFILALANSEVFMTSLIVFIFELAITIIGFKWIFKLLEKDVFFWLNFFDSQQSKNTFQLFYDQICVNSLYQLNKSGINYADALHITASLFKSKTLKSQLIKASSLCQNGNGLSSSLNQAKLPLTSQCHQLLLTAEQTGDWQGALSNYLDNNQEYLDDILNGYINFLQKGLFVIAALLAFTVIF